MVRTERPDDGLAIQTVHERAFGRAEEALLVGTLRAAGAVTLSLVAEDEGAIVGHVLFSPVTFERAGHCHRPAGLGPLAVLPEYQGRGVGALLVRAGLERLRAAGHDAVVVLGHPTYYPRFGFTPARRFGLRWEMEITARPFDLPESAANDAFMACELRPGALQDCGGVVRFRPEFTDV